MARCRVVVPDVVRVEISEGDWLDLKRRLSHGERQKMFSLLLKNLTPDGQASLDREMVGTAQLMAYLADWSLVDPNGKQIRIDTDARKLAAINSLDDATVTEMLQAVDQHIEAMEVEITTSKKTSAGDSESSAT